MTAKEKFNMVVPLVSEEPPYIRVHEWNPAPIFLHDTYFSCKRNLMRGLEEYIVDAIYNEEGKKDHDYVDGRYFYEIDTIEGMHHKGPALYIMFDHGMCTFGSKFTYGA